MDHDQGLFTADETDVTFEENVSYHDNLVGEGKKYKDSEALAKSRIEADAFILRLQNENAVIRAELQKRDSVEEAVKRLTQRQPAQDTVEEAPPPAPGSHKDGLTLEDVEALLQHKLADREAQNRQKTNSQIVIDELKSRFGSQWKAVLKAKQEELGVTEQYLEEQARVAPKALLALVGSGPRSDSFTPPSGSFDTSKRPQTTSSKNFAYFEKIRLTSPTEYWKPHVQNEMHKEAIKQGDAFWR